MSKTTMTVIQCDLCGQTPAETWHLSRSGDRRVIDLCVMHMDPVLALWRKAKHRGVRQDAVRQPLKNPKRVLRRELP